MTPPIRLTGATADDRLRYGQLIKDARKQRGMTQTELSSAANVSRKTVSNIENGTHTAQEDILRRLFAAVGLATDDDAHSEHVTAYMEMFGTLMESVPESRQLEAMNRTTSLLTSYFTPGNVSPITRDGTDEVVTIPDDLEDDFTEDTSPTHLRPVPRDLPYVAGTDDSEDELYRD